MRPSVGCLILLLTLSTLSGCVDRDAPAAAQLTLLWPADVAASYADRASAIAAALEVELAYWIAPHEEGTAVTITPGNGTLDVVVENTDGSRFALEYEPEQVPENATTRRIVVSRIASPSEWFQIPLTQAVNGVTFMQGGGVVIDLRPGMFVGAPEAAVPAVLERLGTSLLGSADGLAPKLDGPFGEAAFLTGLSYDCAGCTGSAWQDHVQVDADPQPVDGINGTAAVFDQDGSLLRLVVEPRARVHGDLVDEGAARATFEARLDDLGYGSDEPPHAGLVADTAEGRVLYCGFATISGEDFMWSACIDAATRAPVEEHLEWTNGASGELPHLPPWS